MSLSRSSISFFISVLLHVLIIAMLIMSFEKKIFVQEPPLDTTELIDAVIVNQQTLQEEVARIDAVETKKREDELERIQELERKEQEAKELRRKEEALAQALKEKEEQLKKEAEQKRQMLLKEEQERQEK